MSSILQVIKGYCKMNCKGAYVERFFNQCIKRDVYLWEIEKQEDIYSFYVSVGHVILLKDLAKATATQLSIEQRFGLPYFFHRHKKRKLLFVGAIVSVISLYIMSGYIWDIKIDGANQYSKKEVLDYIEHNYIKGITKQNSFETVALEDDLRNHFKKTAWVSCELKGTQLCVHMKETIPVNEIKKSTKPCDIVAAKDGTVALCVVRKGVPVRSIGESVKKGDVLIAGLIQYHDDAGECIQECYVPADGDVYATTKYHYKKELSLKQYVKEKKGKSKVDIGIGFGKKTWMLRNFRNSQENIDCNQEMVRLKLGHTFYLPIVFIKKRWTPYVLNTFTRTKEQTAKVLKKQIQKDCKEFSQKGVEIVENNVTIKEHDGGLVAEGTIVVKELIGVPQIVQDSKKENTDGSDRKTSEHIR